MVWPARRRDPRGTVILGNRLAKLRPLLDGTVSPLRYLVLTETEESRRIREYLRSRPDSLELDAADLLRRRREQFRRGYLQLWAGINQRNSSLAWWALPLTSKDPTVTTLCQDVSAFLLLVDLVRQGYRNLLVVTDSPTLGAQVTAWARSEGIKVICAVRQRHGWRRAVKLWTPAAVLRASCLTFYLWLRTRRYRPASNTQDGQVVVVSPVHLGSYTGQNGYSDLYFGPLVEQLEESGSKALVMGLVFGPVQPHLLRLKGLRTRVPVAPVEAFLSLNDLLSCTLRSLWRFALGVRVRGTLQIDGVDVSILVQRTFSEVCRSGNPFMNLRVYQAARRLARRVRVKRCLYPYENRSWEKMLLLAMRRVSPRTRLVGYQHAAITPSHLQFILGAGEAEVTPLPDVLLTTGPRIRDWLEREAGYPAGVVRTACALRYNLDRVSGGLPREPQRPKRVLVALGTAGPEYLEEYVNTLHLVDKAFNGAGERQAVIRPHPTNGVPLERALRAASLAPDKFPLVSTGDLNQALQEVDAVAYASSTVALEAAAAGVPTVWLDLGMALDTDPMWGWNDFKWQAQGPESLLEALDQIDALPEERLEELRRRAGEYARSYLAPVTDESLRCFLDA